MRQNIKAITYLAPATNITEVQHMLGLIEYYRKFFPIFSNLIRPLNELTRKKCTIHIDRAISEKLRLNPCTIYTAGKGIWHQI